jgi:hypothetical protein
MIMIKELKNPVTEKYINFKNLIFSGEFPWYIKTTTSFGPNGKNYYSHSFLQRPSESGFSISKITSNFFDDALETLSEIAIYNNLYVNYFLRINANTNYNQGGSFACDPHYDHAFPHKNLLIYLSQSSGATVVIDPQSKIEEYFHPREDAIITFEGEHYHYQPNIGEKRVVLVATYV